MKIHGWILHIQGIDEVLIKGQDDMTNNWRGTVYGQIRDSEGPIVHATVTKVEETPRVVHVQIETAPADIRHRAVRVYVADHDNANEVRTEQRGKSAYQMVLDDERKQRVNDAKRQVGKLLADDEDGCVIKPG